MKLEMYTHAETHWKKTHDRQVCADPAAANFWGTWTGGNGVAHYKGQRAI